MMQKDFREAIELLSLLSIVRNESIKTADISSKLLFEYEKTNDIKFPPELQKWLNLCNSTSLVDGNLYGINREIHHLDIAWHYCYEPEWKSKGWIPLSSDGCGDFYVLDTENKIKDLHPVYFLDQINFLKPSYIVASNLYTFLKFRITESIFFFQNIMEYFWPFDKKKVIEIDPDIVLCTTAPMPWDSD